MSLTNFAESLIDLFRLRVLTPLLPEAAESSIPAAKFKNQPHKIHSNSLPSEMIVSLKNFLFLKFLGIDTALCVANSLLLLGWSRKIGCLSKRTNFLTQSWSKKL